MCFGLFKKKTPVAASEPIIPLHRQAIIKQDVRKEKVIELKKMHKKEKANKLVTDVIAEDIRDKKLVDIDFGKTDISLFQVNGVYNVGPTILISGFLESGRLKTGMKAIVNEITLKITEVRKEREKVSDLIPGQEGTIVVSAKKSPLLKQGDFLEFE
jgi:hypothetical protein